MLPPIFIVSISGRFAWPAGAAVCYRRDLCSCCLLLLQLEEKAARFTEQKLRKKVTGIMQKSH